jgi:hypothetical protein
MASTYTTGFGIEKIGTGEQAGAWGTTTNHNADILDRIASYTAVALTGTTHTLTVREASPGSGTENLQDGMYRVIKFTGALGANNTVTIAPNTSPAWFIIENATTDSGSSGPYSVILTQGSGANVTVQNGKNAIIYCDGAGSGAVVYDALADLQVGTLEVTGAAAIDGALTAAAISATTLTTSGIASIDDTTDTTSGTTGSIHTDGGVGVAKALYVGTTAKIIGVTTHGGDVVSDTDGTDSLGTTAVRWLKGWFDSLTVTGDVGAATGTFSGEVTGAGFTGTLDGVLGGGTPAAATVTTLNGVTAPTAQYTSAEETKLAGIETAADVTDATNVLAGLVGQEVVATGFTGTLDGVLGGGTPAAVTATTVTASGVTTVNAYAQTGFIVNAAGHDAGIRIATDNVGYACGLELADGTTSWYVVNSWGPSSSFGIGRNNQGTDLTINSSGNVGIPGALAVTGAVSKGSGSFKIRHPLVSKKDTHNLVHSFIEGPQADLIYRGRATLTSGSATVNIDVSAGMTAGTFEVLCRDVQCFTSNESGWTCVRGSVSGATLTIEAEANDCIDTISWMVVGERKDIHMYETEWTDENGRVIVEPEIPVEETTVFEKHSGV